MGNFFIGSDTATIYGIEALKANLHKREIGNSFSDNLSWYGTTDIDSASDVGERRSREARYIDLGTDNSASLTFDTTEYGLITLERSDATAATLSANCNPPLGAWLTIVIRKTNVGNTGNMTFSSTYFADDAGPYIVAGSSYRVFTFRGVNRGTGNNLWTLVNATGDMT